MWHQRLRTRSKPILDPVEPVKGILSAGKRTTRSKSVTFDDRPRVRRISRSGSIERSPKIVPAPKTPTPRALDLRPLYKYSMAKSVEKITKDFVELKEKYLASTAMNDRLRNENAQLKEKLKKIQGLSAELTSVNGVANNKASKPLPSVATKGNFLQFSLMNVIGNYDFLEKF